jgi:hypothetical protein
VLLFQKNQTSALADYLKYEKSELENDPFFWGETIYSSKADINKCLMTK